MDETSLFTGLKKRKTGNKTRQNTCPKKKDKIQLKQIRGHTRMVNFRMVQKQPPEMFCKKGSSKKFRKLHRKTHALESQASGLQLY